MYKNFDIQNIPEIFSATFAIAISSVVSGRTFSPEKFSRADILSGTG